MSTNPSRQSESAERALQELREVLDRGRRLADNMTRQISGATFRTAAEVEAASLRQIRADPVLNAAYNRGWADRSAMLSRLLNDQPPAPYSQTPRQPVTRRTVRTIAQLGAPVQRPQGTAVQQQQQYAQIPYPIGSGLRQPTPAATMTPGSQATAPRRRVTFQQPGPPEQLPVVTPPTATTDTKIRARKTPAALRRDAERRKAFVAAKRAAQQALRKAESEGPSQQFRLQKSEPAMETPLPEADVQRPSTSREVEMGTPDTPAVTVNPDVGIVESMDTIDDAVLYSPGPTLPEGQDIEPDTASFHTLSPPTSPRDE